MSRSSKVYSIGTVPGDTDLIAKPLSGKRVLVTRARQQAAALSEMLAQEGAQPCELPTIEVKPVADWFALDRALLQLYTYHWVVFTSANAVDLFFQRLATLGKDAQALGDTKVCAIGPGTEKAVRDWGALADFVPTEYVSDGVLEGLRRRVRSGDRLLLPRALGAREALPHGLKALGVQVDEIGLYELHTPAAAVEQARRILDAGIDVVTFTSPSTVRNLVQLLNGEAQRLEPAIVACIGPITAAAARQAGLRVDVEAKEYTVLGLVKALVDHFAEEGMR